MTKDLQNGVVGELGTKVPCRAATMTNIDLVLNGLNPFNGITPIEGDIILVNLQDDETENGVYIASTSAWQRAVWFDNELDAVPGTLIYTVEGTQYSKTLWATVCADNPIQFGTSIITFDSSISGTNTGDVTLTGQNYLSLSDQQITANKIGLFNMANLAANSFIGNNTGSATTPIALTQSQATNLLNVVVGDSGSGGTKGLVPAPAAGDTAANKFLKADGNWQLIPTATKATTTMQGISYLNSTIKISNFDVDKLNFSEGIFQFNDGSGQAFATAKTKILQSSGSWAPGNGQNGLFIGARTQSTWYHCFAIYNPTTDSVDFGFDTSVTAANIPAGYTKYSLIESIKTNSSPSADILIFYQFGDYIQWDIKPLDISILAPSSTFKLNYKISTPIDRNVKAILSGNVSSSSTSSRNLFILSPFASSITPSVLDSDCSTENSINGSLFSQVMTDTDSQVSIIANFSSDFIINIRTVGWIKKN